MIEIIALSDKDHRIVIIIEIIQWSKIYSLLTILISFHHVGWFTFLEAIAPPAHLLIRKLLLQKNFTLNEVYQLVFRADTASGRTRVNIAVDDIGVSTSDNCQAMTTPTIPPVVTPVPGTILSCNFEKKGQCQWTDDTSTGTLAQIVMQRFGLRCTSSLVSINMYNHVYTNHQLTYWLVCFNMY